LIAYCYKIVDNQISFTLCFKESGVGDGYGVGNFGKAVFGEGVGNFPPITPAWL